ncbi:hypothetical protein EWH99_13580 [Sporolactobacillus sp. THM7-7]|nr:hypothetical protein EWH99_13580 [Sporolactobacillus sp. THM7-7]
MSTKTKEAEAEYALINAIGTVIAAIGATPRLSIPDNVSNGMDIVGNMFQAAGNALDADISENLDALGGGTQAFGNSLIIYGSLAPIAEKDSVRVIMIGNGLQALGNSLSLHSNLISDERNQEIALSIVGNLLQMMGNSLQALSTIFQLIKLDETKSEPINTTGSWLQAIGAVLEFIATFHPIGDDVREPFGNKASKKF